MSEEAPVNIGALLSLLFTAGQRVLGMQTKLHRWATADPGRRFDDLYNLVHDPAFLVCAWERVSGNTGARSAGVDRRTVRSIVEPADGVAGFLEGLRAQLKARTFQATAGPGAYNPETGQRQETSTRYSDEGRIQRAPASLLRFRNPLSPSRIRSTH